MTFVGGRATASVGGHQRADGVDEAIPEGGRANWYERADEALEAAGMPEWMRITPTVKEAALRLWVATTIPKVATG